MHEMFNIVAAEVGDPQAVLIRAAEPLEDWKADLSGPGKLTRALQISRALNGEDLTGEQLYLIDDRSDRPRVTLSPRIGVDYAGDWKHELLRFVDLKSHALSSRKGLPDLPSSGRPES
jgi:DNA-3-methyladenine glycosylase